MMIGLYIIYIEIFIICYLLASKMAQKDILKKSGYDDIHIMTINNLNKLKKECRIMKDENFILGTYNRNDGNIDLAYRDDLEIFRLDINSICKVISHESIHKWLHKANVMDNNKKGLDEHLERFGRYSSNKIENGGV